MSKDSNANPTAKKSVIGRWFSRWFFGSKKEMNIFEEEQVHSPLRTVVSNFFSRRLSVVALCIFAAIFLFVMIGPYFFPLDLSYNESTQANVSPGMNLMSVPSALKGNIEKISVGPTFSVGISKDGELFLWGKTKLSAALDLKNIPESVKKSKIVDVAAGYDHIVAMTDTGRLIVWGNNRLGQDKVTTEAEAVPVDNVKQLIAGYQVSAILTNDGYLYFWGNSNLFDITVKPEYQGNIEKVAMTLDAYVCLLKDGSVCYTGQQSTAYSNIPANLSSDVIDIAASSKTCAAISADGTVTVWGNVVRGENQVPTFASPISALYGGRFHYTALLENGDVVCWGDNYFNQATVPAKVNKAVIRDIYTGYYQNYVVTEDDSLYTWGLRGYACGTDDLGRDVLNRLINGGKMTMTVGAVSVVISTLIGVILGGVAGYFGGKVDMIVMRISEIVGGLPFLPFAMILSAIVHSLMNESQRIYLIMVILGVLSWPSICRLIRAQILSAREGEFVVAAKAMGVKEISIVFRHILPNVISIIVVSATLDFATCMLIESSLSYLGFGISPPQPTWGNMLKGANNSIVIQQYWWRWVFPSLVFALCTICINTIGDGLRDAIDPKSNSR